jgi:hypothetical protein
MPVDARYSSSVLMVLSERLICAGSAIVLASCRDVVVVKCICQGLVGWATGCRFGDGLQEQGKWWVEMTSTCQTK